MIRRVIVGVIMVSAVVVHTTRAIGAQAESMSAFEQSYLQQATESQQAEMTLGQLAVQKASSTQVKQYGARMIQDHKRLSEALPKLTSKEVPTETGELSMPHQQIQRLLSQLSGKEFDKAYISFMLRDHMKDVGEWEQRAQTVSDARVERWMAAMLPILKEHIEQGKAIAAAIGVSAEDLAKVEDATSPSHPY